MTNINFEYKTSCDLKTYDTFEDPELNLKDEILHGLYNNGYEKPSQIQRIGIAPICQGNDCVIQSHSGSGKTATFIIGMLQRINLNAEFHTPQSIILSNTRELAIQTFNVCSSLIKNTKVTCKLCIGGMGQPRQITDDIIIATPGRLKDLLYKNCIYVKNISIIIIDEADELFSQSFKLDMYDIFKVLPSESQIVLLSATITPEFKQSINGLLRTDYITIYVDNIDLKVEGIKQYFIEVDEQDKFDLLMELYKSISVGQAIIYCNSQERVKMLGQYLLQRDYTVSILYGKLSPFERDNIMNDFIHGTSRILITTDVTARGIDIQQVSLVINYDIPNNDENFVHRIGRTSRFGRKGCAISFISHRDRYKFADIQRKYNYTFEQLNINNIFTF